MGQNGIQGIRRTRPSFQWKLKLQKIDCAGYILKSFYEVNYTIGEETVRGFEELNLKEYFSGDIIT